MNTQWLDSLFCCPDGCALNFSSSQLPPQSHLQSVVWISSPRMEPHCRLSVEINQSPMPFVVSAHLNEIALAALHQTFHNDSSSTLNLHRPLHILTTAEDTLGLRCHSLYSFSTLYSDPSTNALTSFLLWAYSLFVVRNDMSDSFY